MIFEKIVDLGEKEYELLKVSTRTRRHMVAKRCDVLQCLVLVESVRPVAAHQVSTFAGQPSQDVLEDGVEPGPDVFGPYFFRLFRWRVFIGLPFIIGDSAAAGERVDTM